MKGNRRALILAAFLGLLAVYYGWSWLRQDSGPAGAGAGPGGSRAARETREVVALAFDDLEREPAVYSPGRDLFGYGGRRVVAEPIEEVQPVITAPPTPTPTPREPPKPLPPEVTFFYLGSFGPSGRKIAVFTDEQAVYNARVGDVIKEQFVLVNIGFESVDIGFVNFPDADSRRLAVGGP